MNIGLNLSIISFVLQIVILPIWLSKATAQLDIIDTLIGMILAGLFSIISSIDVGVSALTILVTVFFTLFIGAFLQIDDFYLEKTTKIRVCMYFWIFLGVLISNIIIYLRCQYNL